MATLKTPPYKQFLTPALHRRFTGAAVVIFAICYVEAILIGEKSSFFWSWFPIGSAGIKTLLLFISALSIFVLRVAQLHLGVRTTPSPFTTFTQYLLRIDTIQTAAWYLFSAWWFSEVYVWSASHSADLGWISQGKSWERRKLNERPIYLRSVFFILAILQSSLHLYYDYDQVALSTDVPPKPEPAAEKPLGLVASTKVQLLAQAKPLLPLFWYDKDQISTSISRNIVLRALFVSVLSPFIYAIFIRRTSWSWSLSFAALIWDVPPSRLSFIPPHYPSLIYRSLTSGFFLVLLWEASNALFTAYVAQAPLKNGQPFTAESKDPNGTLLTGLKSKKEIPKTFALWELLYISTHTSIRRKALFTDIDRPSGPLWTSFVSICLSQLTDIHTRINPPTASSTVPSKPVPIETLPRLTPPLRQDSILLKSPAPSTTSERLESTLGSAAKFLGQSPTPGTLKLPSAASSQARQVLSQKLLPLPQQQKLLTGPPGSISPPSTSTLLPHLTTFLRTPLGHPFRSTLPRRARCTILNSPTSSLHQIISSIRILSNLAAASLTEDPYGKVAADVPLLIRTFVSTIRAVEGYVGGLGVHWTDVERLGDGGSSRGKEGRKREGLKEREVEGVKEVIAELRMGLRSLLDGFGKFATELGMEKAEVGIAKEVAGRGMEMQKVAS